MKYSLSSIAWVACFCLLCLVANGSSEPVSVTAIPSSLYALRGVTNSIDVLFQIKTEAIKQEKEAPVVEVAVVLDVSGSMAGNLLQFSKQAINDLLAKMGPEDIVHLVIYNYDGSVVFKNGNIKDLEHNKNFVNQLYANGGTNMMAGVEKAYQILVENKAKENSRLQRIMVFSDGEVNIGVTDSKQIMTRIGEMAENGIAISSFGVGNNYNENLMRGIAETGKGDYFYMANAEVIPQLVDKSLRGLMSVVGTDAVLKIRGANGAIVTKIFNHDDIVAGAQLGDLKSNDMQQILAVVDYAPSKQGDSENMLVWSLSYTLPNQKVPVTLKGTVNIMFTDNDAQAKDINPVVEAVRAIFEISQSDNEILEMVDQGKIEEAIQRKREDVEKLEKIKEKDESGMAEMFSKQAKQTLESMQNPEKSRESIRKEVHYGQYVSKEASLYLSDTEWSGH